MNTQVQESLGKALAFLDRLEQLKLWYHMIHVRDSLMVIVTLPGQRWEIEFFEDGSVDIERFVSTGEVKHISDQELSDLFAPYEDDLK